jgi:hypothetical protein
MENPLLLSAIGGGTEAAYIRLQLATGVFGTILLHRIIVLGKEPSAVDLGSSVLWHETMHAIFHLHEDELASVGVTDDEVLTTYLDRLADSGSGTVSLIDSTLVLADQELEKARDGMTFDAAFVEGRVHMFGVFARDFLENPTGTQGAPRPAITADALVVARALSGFGVDPQVILASYVEVCKAAQDSGIVSVFSNFGTGDTYTTNSSWQLGGPADWPYYHDGWGAAFTPAQSASLDTLRVVLNHQGEGNEFDVSVWSDSGNFPGAVLESFHFSNAADVFPGTLLEANSTVRPLLAAGAQYWVVVSVPSSPRVWGGWHQSLSSIGDQGRWVYMINGGPWEAVVWTEGFTRGVFEVIGTPIP